MGSLSGHFKTQLHDYPVPAESRFKVLIRDWRQWLVVLANEKGVANA
jgi:hypothetical protein